MSDFRTGDEERVLFEHELHRVALLAQLTREQQPNEFRGLPRLPERRRRDRVVVCTPATWDAYGIDWSREWS